MTECAMAIPIKNQKDGDKLKTYLMSDAFKIIRSSCLWGNFRVDWRMFKYFKKGFWRDDEK